tara:strand:- start:1925 stop:3835 length:1911 start_codon:yes stop_codon:yes gene_type:complete
MQQAAPQVRAPIQTFGSIKPIERGWMDTYFMDPLTSLLGDDQAARARAQKIMSLGEMLPGVGEAAGLAQAGDLMDQGHPWLGAGVGGLTLAGAAIPPLRGATGPLAKVMGGRAAKAAAQGGPIAKAIPRVATGNVVANSLGSAGGRMGPIKNAFQAAGDIVPRSPAEDAIISGGREVAGPSSMPIPGASLVQPRPGPIATALGSPILPGDTRISSRMPYAASSPEDPFAYHLGPSLEAAMLDKKGFAKNSALAKKYPGFKGLRGNPRERAEGYIEQATGNLHFLHQSMNEAPHLGEEITQRMSHWYDGANQISKSWSQKYGIDQWRMSGVLASLSPQKDWFQNVSLAERLVDTVSTQAGKVASPEMITWAKAHYTPAQATRMSRTGNMSLTEMDASDKALWVRAYDEVYNPKNHRRVTPEGEFGSYMTNKNGAAKKIAWGSMEEIEKAIIALEAPDVATFALRLGPNHKVRSFYNNIETPMGRYGDTTMDTHAVAAAQLMPLSGNTPQVSHNFGSSLAPKNQPKNYTGAANSSIYGNRGSYPINQEAYTRFAEQAGVLPRQGQSITWEGVRLLFPDVMKNKLKGPIGDIWKQFDSGAIGLNDARRMVMEKAGGFGTPDWLDTSEPLVAASRASSFR